MSIASAIRRELLWLLIGLPAGALLLPVLIWLVGARVFGAYAGGETGDLVRRFFQNLGQGDSASWLVALGPYAGLLLLRLALRLLRRPTPVEPAPEQP